MLSCQSKEKKIEKNLPETVKVQSILIAFEGSLPGKEIERSKEEAQKLAQEVFEQAQIKETNFESLVISHSDDMIPGVFELSSDQKTHKTDVFSRTHLPKAWADQAFALEVGQVALVPYIENQAAFGFYILKRLE